MAQHHDPAYNRDDQQKPADRPGEPPRAATEPKGAEGEAETAKTLTDPASGESRGDAHAPNQAKADQTDGAPRTDRRG